MNSSANPLRALVVVVRKRAVCAYTTFNWAMGALVPKF